MEMNHLYLSWVLSALSIVVGFTALYYANEAKNAVEKRINKFIETTISKIEKETGEINDKVGGISDHINEQLNKLRFRDETLREEIVDTQEKLGDLRAELRDLDKRILPKYKR